MNTAKSSIAINDDDLKAIIGTFTIQQVSLFQDYKISTLKRRVIRRMKINNIFDFQEYLHKIASDSEEQASLIDDFLINVTDFFRDKEAYDTFSKEILPNLVANCDTQEGLKIWVCACSTGEEAYSLAIVINEYLLTHQLDIPFRIFATDINVKNIEKARKNQYTIKELSCVPASLLEKYFSKSGKYYAVVSGIKHQIYFSTHNILKNPPIIKSDFISCRNLLIYLKLEQQYKVLQKLHHSLKKNGVLWLGANESSLHLNNNYEELNGKWKFYQKKELNIALPINVIYDFDEQYIIPNKKFQETTNMYKNTENPLPQLDQFGFASLVVNKDFDIITSNGNFNAYLQMPEYQLKLNLINMLPKAAKYEIRQLILDSIHSESNQQSHKIDINDGHTCSVWVIPSYNGSSELISIIFGNLQSKEKEASISNQPKNINTEYAQQLEDELASLQKKYDSLIKEFDSNTYSLQIVNEDLMSTNEEMQSANEELQALNEELNNLNVEYQQKIRDLQNLNEDFDNYFKNSNTAQIILDANLQVKRFNPKAQQYFNVLQQDLGRPLHHLSNQFVNYDIDKDLLAVQSKNEIRTTEVKIKNDQHATILIAPYIKANQQVDGVVISIVDTTEVYQINSTFQAVFHNNFNAIVIIKPEYSAEQDHTTFKIVNINHLAESMIGLPYNEILDKSIITIMSNILGEKGISSIMESYSRNEKTIEDISFKKGLITLYYELAVKPINNGLILIFRDTTKQMESIIEQRRNYTELLSSREQLNQANINLEQTIHIRTKDLIESNERFNLLTIATNDIIRDWDLSLKNYWINDNFYKILGYPKAFEINNEDDWLLLVAEEDKEKYLKYINDFSAQKKSEFELEYSILNIDGERLYVHEKGFLYYDESGTARRFISSIRELTTVREAQRVLEQQLKDKNEFLSIASHELKTPVTSIKGAIQLLDMYYADEDDEMAQKLINTAVNQTNRLSAFVEDLLDVTRINEGKLTIDLKPLHITNIINSAIAPYHINQEKQINTIIQENVQDEIMGDEKRLEQVMVNVVSNALKYSPKSDRVDIFISNEKEGMVTVNVQDYGIGMTQKQIDRIFDSFNGSKLTSKEFTGLGLGMYITKDIVDQHKGTIDIKSKLKEGTSFRISFPLK